MNENESESIRYTPVTEEETVPVKITAVFDVPPMLLKGILGTLLDACPVDASVRIEIGP